LQRRRSGGFGRRRPGKNGADQDQEDDPIANHKSKSHTVRVQYAALPYRLNKAGEIEVLLLTSRTRRRWIIPKGWPIKGLKPAKSAAREAFEEAGVRGTVSSKPLGRFIYDKQIKTWPEFEQRETRWVAASEAATLTDEDGLRPLLEAFSAKMDAKRKPATEQGPG
jgi:ADP-ribose pyrophosphatase YjhB (NUDIX family)